MNDSNEVKRQSQQTWASGDYAILGSRLVIVSELLCETVDLRANHHVLDAATGHGNTALAAARRGCTVTGIDFTKPLLEHARQRAAAERLQISFQEGDVEDIPFPDEAFDIVLSTFGVMFAADQRKATRELLRVCRAGGKIGLANWALTGWAGRLTQMIGGARDAAKEHAMGKYFPLAHVAPSILWKTAEGLQELFRDQVASLQTTPRSVIYRFPSLQAYIDTVFTTYGPIMEVVQVLSDDERTRLKSDLADALRPFNQSGDETLVLPCDYIEAVAIK